MKNVRNLAAAALAALVALATPSAAAQKNYDPGASDTTVRIGQTGPTGTWGAIGQTMQAYFRMVNEKGGINGRKIELITYDDAYDAAKTSEVTRKAVETDKVLFMSGSIGTGPQLAVAPYLNQLKVPQLFMASPSGNLAAAKKFPYSMMAMPSYESEGAIWLRHLTATKPKAKVAVLYQNDEMGHATLNGFKQDLEKTRLQIVSEQPYALTEPSIDAQINAMKASGADTVLLITTQKMTVMALQKIRGLAWSNPTIYLSQGGSSIKTALTPAGLDNAKRVIVVAARMSIHDVAYANHPDMQAYLAFIAQYMPGTNGADDDQYLWGYSTAALTAHVIEQAGNNLTRENILKIATSLRGYHAPLLLPGVTLNSSPTDYRLFQSMQIRQFDGKIFEPLGPVLSIHWMRSGKL